MKKIIMMFSLMLSIGTVAFAQGQRQMGTPEERLKRNVAALQTKLNLTTDQNAKITAIYAAQGKSMDSLRTAAGEGADRQAMRPKMTEIMDASDKKISALLSDSQKKDYEAWKVERRARMGGGQRPAQAAPAN